MSRRKEPNFFIVGAPKCGTTSLYFYLGQHPDVFMSTNKEPCFFASDFQSPYYPKTLDEYLVFFRDATNENRIGEATTTYLYSLYAAKEIKEFCPSAKIIIMLRNPVDMMYSLHGQRLWEGNENIINFKKALYAENERKNGKKVPKGFKYPKQYLYYREIASFSSQVERYLCTFPRENIHFIMLDDLKTNNELIFYQACDFLEIQRYNQIKFDIQNPSKGFLYLIARKFFNTPGFHIINRSFPCKLRRTLKTFHIINRYRPPMSKKLRKKLILDFKPEIDRLGDLISQNLTSWYS